MSGSRYWEADDGGRRFLYNSEASFECPVGKLVTFSPDDEPPAKLVIAAAALGMDAHRLGVMLRKSNCGGRDRVDGKLTDRCYVHGVKMERRGFRAFVEEPIPEAEWETHTRSQVAINTRLGDPDYVPRRVVEQRWCLTKKEARAWAYGQFKIAQAEGATA